MQTQFIDRWNEFSKCASKPFVDLMELNINTFNEWTKNSTSLNEMTKIKKPEDFLTIQAELGTNMMKSMTEYMQKFSEIWMESANHLGKMCNDCSREVMSKASEGVNVFKQTADQAANKAKSDFKKIKSIHSKLKND